MCGRLTLKTPPAEWSQLLLPLLDGSVPKSVDSQAPLQASSSPDSWAITANWQPRYNIAPTQDVSAVLRDAEEALVGVPVRWGLVPRWASDLKLASRMINARAETVDEKRSFAKPLESQRCLILADGYYEWQAMQEQGKPRKQPCWIAPSDGGCIFLAGLWDRNQKATGEDLVTCTILTTAANPQLASIHDRMPVMLCGDAARTWVDPKCGAQDAKALLGPAEEGFFSVTKVSTLVNNVRNDQAECLDPVASQGSLF